MIDVMIAKNVIRSVYSALPCYTGFIPIIQIRGKNYA